MVFIKTWSWFRSSVSNSLFDLSRVLPASRMKGDRHCGGATPPVRRCSLICADRGLNCHLLLFSKKDYLWLCCKKRLVTDGLPRSRSRFRILLTIATVSILFERTWAGGLAPVLLEVSRWVLFFNTDCALVLCSIQIPVMNYKMKLYKVWCWIISFCYTIL